MAGLVHHFVLLKAKDEHLAHRRGTVHWQTNKSAHSLIAMDVFVDVLSHTDSLHHRWPLSIAVRPTTNFTPVVDNQAKWNTICLRWLYSLECRRCAWIDQSSLWYILQNTITILADDNFTKCSRTLLVRQPEWKKYPKNKNKKKKKKNWK